MNVHGLIVQLFQELGYHKEKQVRLKKIKFTGPPPGTYRIDNEYYRLTDYKKCYLTTKRKEMIEFFCEGDSLTITCLNQSFFIDLNHPDSLNEIEKIIHLLEGSDEDNEEGS